MLNAHETIPSLARYEKSLRSTAHWIRLSIQHGEGGSCAFYSPLLGWSHPYPETTGYLIPTLLALDKKLSEPAYTRDARAVGEWLLNIQMDSGAWQAGMYSGSKPKQESVFNTGQIVKGLIALHRHTGEQAWLDAATKATDWLCKSATAEGDWGAGEYRSRATPSYYTHVAWPMLEYWNVTGDKGVRNTAEKFLDLVCTRIRANGAIDKWGFDDGPNAFTHTIAYTFRGLLEAARLTGQWDRYGAPTVRGLELLRRRAELLNGRLPGSYDLNWKPTAKSSCLTGNVQIALCLLAWEERSPDLRIINAATKLVDWVCARQRLQSPIPYISGAVSGSSPSWGSYMTFRYPNWAAKYHCDALMRLITRVESEAQKSQ